MAEWFSKKFEPTEPWMNEGEKAPSQELFIRFHSLLSAVTNRLWPRIETNKKKKKEKPRFSWILGWK